MVQCHPPLELEELPKEDEERLETLFSKLDTDGNGKIDIHDLSVALKELAPHINRSYAEKFLAKSGGKDAGDITLSEFIHYVREHEKNLRLQFSHLDKNKDGKVDLEELISAFADLGIAIGRNEATNLLKRMDQDGSLNISYDEWRDYLLLAPGSDIHALIHFWRHSTYLDIGEDMNVPDDFTQSELQTGKWWRHLLAGGIAGAFSRTCTAPLDRLKVFLQVNPTRENMSKCFKRMIKEGGITGLWRGNGINIIKIAPESAIKFAAYEQVKKLIKGEKRNQPLAIHERFVAGATAGAFSQTVIYPLEVLKTRLALRKTGQYSGIVDAAKKIYAREGLKCFYKGYIPNILGIVPYAGIDLAVYETLKKKYISKYQSNNEQPGMLLLLACGSTSCTLGQVCSYPLALVRTRLQAQENAAKGAEGTMGGAFREIVQREGLFGLYRGITPNFIKVIPAVSISYVVYEYASRSLGVNMT
ncbi:calcium-binding mitochondrial carrier protein SCaMC-2 isoform X2 [Plodia interpunctella]|uniref:calcium-binding mitochondrial carrier protein SCaMC-2 isoform X2 n=1 Tax=Plodia interpunctella TaxID=58824 RepID=UPI0023674BD0|nr:calcium-binding mitochondrial carrier protein SCaMC-2 isoform X2 [Plodia interpunctella]